MSIITQNQGGKILKQNVGEKILKSNYSFGSAWKSYNPGTAYIDITKSISPSQLFCFGFFTKDVGNGVLALNFINSNLGGDQFRVERFDNSGQNVVTAGIGSLSNRSREIQIIQCIPEFQRLNSLNAWQTITANNLSGTITYIRLSRTTSSSLYAKVNGLFIYDRIITLNEALWRKNKGIGNELFTINGLWAEFPLSQAEILNTGGGDFVGVRDVSGNNRHQPILSLPAGTLEEKRDWANANCFELW